MHVVDCLATLSFVYWPILVCVFSLKLHEPFGTLCICKLAGSEQRTENGHYIWHGNICYVIGHGQHKTSWPRDIIVFRYWSRWSNWRRKMSQWDCGTVSVFTQHMRLGKWVQHKWVQYMELIVANLQWRMYANMWVGVSRTITTRRRSHWCLPMMAWPYWRNC